MNRKVPAILAVCIAVALAVAGAALSRSSSTPTLKGVVGPGYRCGEEGDHRRYGTRTRMNKAPGRSDSLLEVIGLNGSSVTFDELLDVVVGRGHALDDDRNRPSVRAPGRTRHVGRTL